MRINLTDRAKTPIVAKPAQGCLILKPELTLASNKSLGKCGRSGAKIDVKIL